MPIQMEKGNDESSICKPPIKLKIKRNSSKNIPYNKKDTESIITEEIANIIEKEEVVQKEIEKILKNVENQEKTLLDHIGDFSEEPYSIIESYFTGQHLERLVRHQIESYNHFVNYQIQRTIQMFNPAIIHSDNDYNAEKDKYFLEVHVNFSNFKLYPPQIHENNGATKLMLPQEAKIRNFTYASTMNIDIHIQYIVRNTENMENPRIIEKVLPKINIGKLPIMLKSSICVLNQNKHIESVHTGECSMDCGGYFIIKGSEKTVLGQERAAENRIYCFDGKNTTKWSWFAEIKSVPDFKCISPKQIEMMIASKNNGFGNGIFISIPRIKNPIELFVLFRALGIISDKQISKYIVLDIEDEKQSEVLNFIQASIIDANKYMTQEDALRHLTASVAYTPINLDKETGSRKKREFALEVLENDLFPHCQTLQQKLYIIGYMARKLIQTSLGWLPPDDRDSYLNKRIELTGTLLNNLFRNYFNKLVKEMHKQIIREINNGSWRSTDDYENIINMSNIYKIMKSTTIENGINRALSTGDFSIKQSNSSKVGVAQVLNRLTYISSLSHLRRINTPLEKSGELIAPRKLHGTTWGFLCCLTGDTEILLSDKINMKKIKDIRDGDWVNTVNRDTLLDEPSTIYNYFSIMPEKLFEITTISGRKIKATSDHPFLINKGNGKYEMVKVEDLKIDDKMIIRHMVNMNISNIDKEKYYNLELLEKNIENNKTCNNGCVSVPILSIKEIEPELVYDFTTHSENHSFVANGFVSSNCVETPEGQSIGVVKNISYMCHITIPTNSNSLYEYVKPHILSVDDTEPEKLNGKVKVFVNGCWLGVSENPIELYNDMKDKKYKGIINIYTSIIFDIKMMEIRICNDGGRLTRPVLRVRDNKALITKEIIEKLVNNEITWNDLLTNCRLDESVVEYIDPDEQNLAMIAMKSKDTYLHKFSSNKYNFTHCEIHPSTIFGVVGSCVPYPDHNQAPRNTYQCLHPDELVWMADRTKKMIKDIVIGDSVLTIHPETLDINETKVVNQFVRPNEYPIYKITTVSGKEIRATEDHKFMTDSGWKTIKEMIENPELRLGMSTNDYSIVHQTIESSEYILNEEIFIKNITEFEMNIETEFDNFHYLENIGLLSLKEDNHILPILCRIIGFIISRGYNEDELIFYFKNKNDAIAFNNDLFKCGFEIKNIEDEITNLQQYNCSVSVNKSLLLFIYGIGINYKECKTIPDWIKKNKEYERQFLKGFIANNPEMVPTINSDSLFLNTIMELGDLIMKIHKKFNSSTYMLNNIIRQNSSKNNINSFFDNIINFYDNVGYVYNENKNIQTSKVIEYLKYNKKTGILNDHDIMSNINNAKLWIEENILEKNNCLFVPILIITPESDGLISCIETESENHSFLTTNAIISSNCAMGKQAMGVYSTNYDQRMDKTAYILNYPTRPLVETRIMNIIRLNQIPSGCQIHVAIMTHTGYNQEDSVLINKGSIDRGLFITTIYHTEKDEDKNIIRDEIIRCKPDPNKTKGIKFGNYDKLNSQGFIPENSLVENRDVIIAKTIPIKENRNDPTKTVKYEDQSKTYRTTEETYIDKNYTGRNGDGYNFAKVRVRTLRKPVLGDKFSSRSGQKGTVGNIIPECDMPFTKDGLRPDIIINPHAIPSRMTIGQLKETLLGKVLIELGLFGDATSFGNLDVKTISAELQKLGYESYGNELMYNGLTGEQLETNIFIGPVFYQRLKHMVNDKQHSRAIGPMVNLTRQPAEGRSRDGGFRIGEMERDVMLAHGMSKFCKERMFDVSDKYSVYVCKKCGMIASYNDGDKNRAYENADFSIHLCKTCDNKTDFALVNIPYAYKLLSQELQTINVVPRIITE
jgi:DNA-directed RNA polymerase beta subunit/intein/homing endonuclease